MDGNDVIVPSLGADIVRRRSQDPAEPPVGGLVEADHQELDPLEMPAYTSAGLDREMSSEVLPKFDAGSPPSSFVHDPPPSKVIYNPGLGLELRLPWDEINMVVSEELITRSIAIRIGLESVHDSPPLVERKTPSLVAANTVEEFSGLMTISWTAVMFWNAQLSPVESHVVPPSVDLRMPMPYDARAPSVPTSGRT